MNQQLQSTLATSKNYTLAVAEAMPDHQYDTTPVHSTWNFRELLHHIAYGIQWWEENYVKGNKLDWNPPVVSKDKKEVIRYLSAAYASLAKTIDKNNLDEEKVKGVYATLDHITHHRGQAVMHLRSQGATVPEYAY